MNVPLLGGEGRILLGDGFDRSLNEQARRKLPPSESLISPSFETARPVQNKVNIRPITAPPAAEAKKKKTKKKTKG